MASDVQIASVKVLLPDGATSYGLTDEIIGSQIDSVGQTKAVLFSLRAIAAKVASIEDISESGSSRTHKFHERLMAMITDYQARADAEDKAEGDLPSREHGGSWKAIRV